MSLVHKLRRAHLLATASFVGKGSHHFYFLSGSEIVKNLSAYNYQKDRRPQFLLLDRPNKTKLKAVLGIQIGLAPPFPDDLQVRGLVNVNGHKNRPEPE